MSHARQLEAERRGNAWVLRLHAERIVDDAQTDDMRRELAAFIATADPPNFVIDLAGVRMVSSAGLSFFQHVSRAVAARHGFVACCRVEPDVRMLFGLVGRDTIFTLFDDVEAAVAAFA
ncbi:MAG: STAS domain-containing protein [Planctomycetia bacterium]